MLARKRTTGRVEHFWINPHKGQNDVWQASCMVGLTVNPSRGIIKVRKDDHHSFFVISPSGSQKCLSCLQRVAQESI
jgi:hypothetical protein